MPPAPPWPPIAWLSVMVLALTLALDPAATARPPPSPSPPLAPVPPLPPTAEIHSQGRDRPKDVIVAGGSVVAEDNRGGIKVERAEVVNPAADALAGAAAGPAGSAVRVVAGDHAGQNRG